MYTDLLPRLRHDVRKINRNEFYLIRDRALADGSFLLYHFISFYLRSPENGKVYVLALNHSTNHYKIVLSKLGVQLQRHVDQRRCRVLDFGDSLSLSDDKASPGFRFGDKDSNFEIATKELYFLVKDEIAGIVANSDSPFLLVVDCVSFFLDFQVPLKFILHFFQYLRNFTREFNASFAVLTKTDDHFRADTIDDRFFLDYDRLAIFLASWGANSFDTTFIFDVKHLASGWSQDVHGEV